MTVVDPDDVTFDPNRMFKLSSRDGVEPNQASIVVANFCECPYCGGSLDDVDVKDGVYSDRDVLWTDEGEYNRVIDGEYVGADELTRSDAHECSECGKRLRIMVEEKALGRLSRDSEYLPDDLEESQIIFVPDDGGYVIVNTHQVFISEER